MNSKFQALGFSLLLTSAAMPAAAQEDVDPAGGPCRLELVVGSSVDWLGPLAVATRFLEAETHMKAQPLKSGTSALPAVSR